MATIKGLLALFFRGHVAPFSGTGLRAGPPGAYWDAAMGAGSWKVAAPGASWGGMMNASAWRAGPPGAYWEFD